MASVVDICNQALSRLGDSATVASIDPPEGSAQAEHCARFYPMARDALLESFPWKFATRRVRLAALAVPSWNWAYAYALPSDCLHALAVLPADAGSDADSQPFEVETGEDGVLLVLTDQPAACLRYTSTVEDSARFPPLFVDALSWLLASSLAGPLMKGDVGAAMAKTCLQYAAAATASAKLSDARQRKLGRKHTPDWIKGR